VLCVCTVQARTGADDVSLVRRGAGCTLGLTPWRGGRRGLA
jgi:hypothetical protein